MRFVPLVSAGRVYFGADDGCQYCLTTDRGELMWRFRAAPNNRRVIGNERLISAWPIRGGPVLVDGRIKFTAGVWPFDSTFLHVVDVVTGTRVESRPLDTSLEHEVVRLNDMTPQDYLAVGDEHLSIPQGRSVVGCRNQRTGGFVDFS